jgi:TRAP-type uncharacterized transport system substrate-binding protein
MNKSLSLTLLATLLLTGTTALADPSVLTVSTGKLGGGYHAVGERLKAVMAEQSVKTEVLNSAGSVENLTRLNDPASPANVGLSQADALKYFLGQQPKFAEKLLILGDIGKECVFIATGKDSGIGSDSDLQENKGNLLAISDPNSGTAITYQYMSQLEPKFKNTQVAFVDTLEALLRLKTGGKDNKVKAVMFVQRPDVKSPAMQAVLESAKDFRFVTVSDWDLNDKLPDGSAVYSFDKVTIQERQWGFDTKVDTICTRGLLLANKDKLSADLRERLSRVILLSGKRVLGEEP